MAEFGKLFQMADWKKEKHAPIIEIPEKIQKGEKIQVTLSVGKNIPHPNTTEHHIAWMDVYFNPEGESFPYHVARFVFASHGASTKGPNTSTVYAEPYVTFFFRTEKSGKLFASSFCNIHGLWVSSADVKVE